MNLADRSLTLAPGIITHKLLNKLTVKNTREVDNK